MDDIDRAKALAALEQLEAEKARRRQAKMRPASAYPSGQQW